MALRSVASSDPPRLSRGAPSNRLVAPLAGSDPERLFERLDKDLPIANAPGSGRGGDERDDLVRKRIAYDDLDLDLRKEVDGVALLAAEAADLAHGHADDARVRERCLHVVELEWLDDRFDLLHRPLTAGAQALLDPRSLTSISSREP